MIQLLELCNQLSQFPVLQQKIRIMEQKLFNSLFRASRKVDLLFEFANEHSSSNAHVLDIALDDAFSRHPKKD